MGSCSYDDVSELGDFITIPSDWPLGILFRDNAGLAAGVGLAVGEGEVFADLLGGVAGRAHGGRLARVPTGDRGVANTPRGRRAGRSKREPGRPVRGFCWRKIPYGCNQSIRGKCQESRCSCQFECKEVKPFEPLYACVLHTIQGVSNNFGYNLIINGMFETD